MGDSTQPPNNGISKQPGIMVVRPSLHTKTTENAAIFKRWTVMHFRDLLNLPPLPDTEGISRALRFTNTKGDLFYTIHADDIQIWKTQAYYEASRRLDLENTRPLEEGEKAVLPASSNLGPHDEPMVWNLVNAEFGIFTEHLPSNSGQSTEKWLSSYQSFPLSLLSRSGSWFSAPPCLLITLTYTSTAPEDEEEEHNPPKRLTDMQSEVASYLSWDCAHGGPVSGIVYTSLYRHASDAQPEMHPNIAEGTDGNGKWVACMMVEGEISRVLRTQLKVNLDDLVDDVVCRENCKESYKDKKPDWSIKVGVWKGEVFVS